MVVVGGGLAILIGLTSFALLTYAFAAIMIGTTLPTPMYALYADRMHFALFTTTVIFATYAIGVLGALLIFGRWSDAIGRRTVFRTQTNSALASTVNLPLAIRWPWRM